MEYIKTKKSLGQHFLRNKQILNKVSGAISDDIKTIIEIGPGEGTLTELLLEKIETNKIGPKENNQLICVEKDDRLIPILEEKFAKEIKNKKLKLIHGDFLEITDGEIKEIVGKNKFAIVGNIPYYITGAIFQKSLESKTTPSEIVFLIQKEVADRICGRGEYEGRRKTSPNKPAEITTKESILSMSIKSFGNPTYIATVDKGQFVPPPKVDSAIIKISDISHDIFKKNKITIENFFSIVKLGFAHKRKVLRSNLNINKFLVGADSKITPISDETKQKLQEIGEMRAEDISLETWIFLTKTLTPIPPNK